MSLRVYTDVNKDSQFIESISVTDTNKLHIKNTGTSAITLYRVKLIKTDLAFTGWFEGGNQSTELKTNTTILPGEAIPFYIKAIEQPKELIKATSLLDINLEYV